MKYMLINWLSSVWLYMHMSAAMYASQALTVRMESVLRPVDVNLDAKTEVWV